MIWPLAQAYARQGYAVRRAGWDNPLVPVNTPAPTGNHLRWISYHNALFYTAYQERGVDYLGNRVIRPTLNLDFTAADFLAADWTVLPPGCSGGTPPVSIPGLQSGQLVWNQEGHYPYPVEGSETPSIDPAFPNIAFGECPTTDPTNPTSPTDPTNPEPPPVFPTDPLPQPETGEPPAVPDSPPPPMPSGGGGGGGGGSGGGSSNNNPRRPKPKPAAAALTVTIDPELVDCLTGETAKEVSVSVRYELGAEPTPDAAGLYWITITCNGQVHRDSIEPGDTGLHVFQVMVIPGKTEITVQGTAYLPVRRLTSRANLVAGPIDRCRGYYVSVVCASCHSDHARLTVTGPGVSYSACHGVGDVTIADTLSAGTTVELSYTEGQCGYHCCDNAIFTILLSRSVEGVSPDAFVNLGTIDLNNASDCGPRSGTKTITQGDIDALAAP
jgi:hypothetical protein